MFLKSGGYYCPSFFESVVKGKSRLNQGCKLFYAFRIAFGPAFRSSFFLCQLLCFFQVRDSVPFPDFSVVLCKPQSSVGTD